VLPLPARQVETALRGVHPLPAQEAESRLQGVQPLPARQAEEQLQGVQPLPPRQAEKQLHYPNQTLLRMLLKGKNALVGRQVRLVGSVTARLIPLTQRFGVFLKRW
jgi:hypothetical protein